MTLKKIKKTLTTNKSSTQLTRLCFFLGLFLIVSIISSKAVFACGITSATLWIGDTTEQAENHNTSIVYRPKAYGNGWHIHWALSPPDDSVEGFIWDETDDVNRGAFWGGPSDRDASGESSYLPGLSVGPHIIKAKIRKVGSESWSWSNPRTLVYVLVDKIKIYANGSWHDADENDTFVLVKGTECTFKAFPYPSTASWPSHPNPTPSWHLNGNPLNPSGEDTKEITFDTFGYHTLVATCGPYDSNSVTVIVPFVHKVVSEGPLYCPNDTADLEAKPYPSDVSFPAGEPHWSIVSQPPDANAALDPISGSATTTLSGLTKRGNYEVKAQCGDSDTGDTIVVSIPVPSTGYWVNWSPSFGCPYLLDPFCWVDHGDSASDFCNNTIEITCNDEDCFYKYLYNGTEVGRCPWSDAHNQFWYKITLDDKHFLETWHTSGNEENSSSGQGCDGYYCWRTERYDCISEEPIGEGVWWERSDEGPKFHFGKPPPGQNEDCPGPSGGGPHPFWPD